MKRLTKANLGLLTAALVFFFLAIFSAARAYSHSARHSQKKDKVVYVCACLKTKSCSCMSMAKSEGPCACGTEGGPPMKAVPVNSDWAKENREALSH